MLILFIYPCIYLLLAVLSLHCWVGYSLAASAGYSLLVVRKLLTAAASPAAEHGLQGAGASVAVDGASAL